MIPNDFIQMLLARVDIVEVIDRHVPLKKAGINYAACCPFHSEKTPSFTVSQTKQFYHCFGCGAHGTAIGFLMEYGGRAFPEAVEELAANAGLQVPREEHPNDVQRREQSLGLSDILLEAARFYRARLKESQTAIAYLKGRGLTGSIAARFCIGYAPDAWQPLATAVARYEDTALETAGLVIAGEGGKRYDRFRDRVMFPIHDNRGQVIGFGGRLIGAGEPRYLNSPETPLFSKGRELYGLYQARAAIRECGRVLVVEGYMDVVALAQHGIEYAVATLGTATTPIHFQKLFRLADRVVFCFDGDDAGRKAAWRALENALPALADGKEATFLFLPDGQDPDDFVRRRGKTAFEALVAEAKPLSEYLLAELIAQHPPSSAESRAALVTAARPYLSMLSAPVLRLVLCRRLAELAGLPEADLRKLLGHAAPRETSRGSGGSRARASLPSRRAPSLVRELLQSLLLQPDLVRAVELPEPQDGTLEGAALSAVVAFCRETTGVVSTPGVLQHFAGSVHASVLAQAVATAHDQGLTPEQGALHLEAGVARYWQQAQRAGRTDIAQTASTPTPEETERLRQLEMVRGAQTLHTQPQPPSRS